MSKETRRDLDYPLIQVNVSPEDIELYKWAARINQNQYKKRRFIEPEDLAIMRELEK